MSYSSHKKTIGRDSNDTSSKAGLETLRDERPIDLKRRQFVRIVTASAAAFAASACGGGGSGPSGGSLAAGSSNATADTNLPAGANRPPAWEAIPTITFMQGVAASFSIAAYVSDADGDALAILKNSVALPQGVTYDVVTKSFVYDGVGPVGSTDGHVLTATEG
jgi:hypothetical protein